MGWNGSGQFTRNYSWINDAANNIPITASRVDADMNDVVGNGLNNCITRDGQGGPTANLPMNGFRHTGASNGVALSDYATMGQIIGLAPLVSPNFSGIPLGPTAANGTATGQLATTAFVNNQIGATVSNYLPLSGGTMTGTFTNSGASASMQVNMPGLVMNTATGNLAPIQVNSPNNPFAASYISFNRIGSFACYFGLDANNALSVGGWSFGANSYRIQHEGISGLTTQSPAVTGTMTYGGITQPHIFVQSSQPTAIATGDLWVW